MVVTFAKRFIILSIGLFFHVWLFHCAEGVGEIDAGQNETRLPNRLELNNAETSKESSEASSFKDAAETQILKDVVHSFSTLSTSSSSSIDELDAALPPIKKENIEAEIDSSRNNNILIETSTFYNISVTSEESTLPSNKLQDDSNKLNSNATNDDVNKNNNILPDRSSGVNIRPDSKSGNSEDNAINENKSISEYEISSIIKNKTSESDKTGGDTTVEGSNESSSVTNKKEYKFEQNDKSSILATSISKKVNEIILAGRNSSDIDGDLLDSIPPTTTLSSNGSRTGKIRNFQKPSWHSSTDGYYRSDQINLHRTPSFEFDQTDNNYNNNNDMESWKTEGASDWKPINGYGQRRPQGFTITTQSPIETETLRRIVTGHHQVVTSPRITTNADFKKKLAASIIGTGGGGGGETATLNFLSSSLIPSSSSSSSSSSSVSYNNIRKSPSSIRRKPSAGLSNEPQQAYMFPTTSTVWSLASMKTPKRPAPSASLENGKKDVTFLDAGSRKSTTIRPFVSWSTRLQKPTTVDAEFAENLKTVAVAGTAAATSSSSVENESLQTTTISYVTELERIVVNNTTPSSTTTTTTTSEYSFVIGNSSDNNGILISSELPAAAVSSYSNAVNNNNNSSLAKLVNTDDGDKNNNNNNNVMDNTIKTSSTTVSGDIRNNELIIPESSSDLQKNADNNHNNNNGSSHSLLTEQPNPIAPGIIDETNIGKDTTDFPEETNESVKGLLFDTTILQKNPMIMAHNVSHRVEDENYNNNIDKPFRTNLSIDLTNEEQNYNNNNNTSLSITNNSEQHDGIVQNSYDPSNQNEDTFVPNSHSFAASEMMNNNNSTLSYKTWANSVNASSSNIINNSNEELLLQQQNKLEPMQTISGDGGGETEKQRKTGTSLTATDDILVMDEQINYVKDTPIDILMESTNNNNNRNKRPSNATDNNHSSLSTTQTIRFNTTDVKNTIAEDDDNGNNNHTPKVSYSAESSVPNVFPPEDMAKLPEDNNNNDAAMIIPADVTSGVAEATNDTVVAEQDGDVSDHKKTIVTEIVHKSSDGPSNAANEIISSSSEPPSIHQIDDRVSSLPDSTMPENTSAVVFDVLETAQTNTEIKSFTSERGPLNDSTDRTTTSATASAELSTVSADRTTLSTVSADRTTLSTVSADRTTLSTVSTDRTTLSTVSTDRTTLSTVSTDRTTLSDTSTRGLFFGGTYGVANIGSIGNSVPPMKGDFITVPNHIKSDRFNSTTNSIPYIFNNTTIPDDVTTTIGSTLISTSPSTAMTPILPAVTTDNVTSISLFPPTLPPNVSINDADDDKNNSTAAMDSTTTNGNVKNSTSTTKVSTSFTVRTSQISTTAKSFGHTTTTTPLSSSPFDIVTTIGIFKPTISSDTDATSWSATENVRRPTVFIHQHPTDIPSYFIFVFKSTAADLCQSSHSLKESLFQYITSHSYKVQSPDQLKLVIDPNECKNPDDATKLIPVTIYIVNGFGSYDQSIVADLKQILQKEQVNITSPIHEIVFRESELSQETRTVVIAGIACIAIISLVMLIFLGRMIRNRQKTGYGQRCTPVSMDDYSLDNISVYNSSRRKSNMLRASRRSYGNPAFDDPNGPSRSLNYMGLLRAIDNKTELDEEFSQIPTVTVRPDELLPGAETKNRYSNVIPLPETRVTLSNNKNGVENVHDYINANYVKGFRGQDKFYIACQAPLSNTIEDFWKMVWKEQSKVIIMLTALVENGVEKCANYLPPSEVLDCHRLFGDFQVTLKKREVREKYIMSSLQLKNMENNLWREVTHFWYSSWPLQGVPSEQGSIIAMLLEARSYMRNSSGPLVVHCSPGTGRTGAIIACDICIREYEQTKTANIPVTVSMLRRCRAGAVQTKDQYAFIYKVLALYAKKLNDSGSLDSI